MNTYTGKTQKSDGLSKAGNASQKQSSGQFSFQLADNRPAAVAQRKMREAANNIPGTTNIQANPPPIQKKADNTGLPDGLKSGIENFSGYSMSDVKVHYNSSKPAQLKALAYAQGTDIHIGPGQEKHLPHEAWHVVQQKQGRVKPTTQLKGKVDINDNTGLEKEADLMGGKALNLGLSVPSKQVVGNSANLGSVQSKPVQRVEIDVNDWGTEDTEDPAEIKSLLESVDKRYAELSEENKQAIFEEYEKGTYNHDAALVALVKKHCQAGGADSSAAIEEEIQREDANAWQVSIGNSKEEQLHFLYTVVAKTRQIIPVAINRIEEHPQVSRLTNDMYLCQQHLVKTFSSLMKSRGLLIDSNYVHPAIVERIMMIVSKQARALNAHSEEEQIIQMAGVCKDYASIAYGLIRQNDPANILKATLGFIKDHVFVTVLVKGVPYVVDAWRTPHEPAIGVLPEAGHIADLNSRKRVNDFNALDVSVSQEKDTDNNNPKKTQSLKDQYADYRQVYKIFKDNQDNLEKEAASFLKTNDKVYDGIGKF
ncbi:eCIS core domain-containing protein [Mucilaginibacter terrigena]|uniref:eCIS core domain-containing protein n=1 Tax=Mucilaginibacter terrigena TaxID=2492395 RepID=UPI0019399BAB|nr:DUF4157 domain-containing protein [Mucilaginibacter terrigena]